MDSQLLFALKMGWKYRKVLATFCKHTRLQCNTVLSLNLLDLKAQGIHALAIDFDGVLAPYGVETLPPPIEQWLHQCQTVFGEGRVYILSNRPTQARKTYFSTHFKGIEVIHSTRKKPHPEGIQRILNSCSLPSSALLMVDDRLLTGILASILTGVQARFLIKPLISFRTHPFQEVFFILLRFLERFFFSLF